MTNVMYIVIALGFTAFNLVVYYLTRKTSKNIKIQIDERALQTVEDGKFLDGYKIKKFEKLKALSDLCLHLIQLKTEMDHHKVNVEGRHAVLDPKDWPKQYELGMNRACGFDIEWKVLDSKEK